MHSPWSIDGARANLSTQRLHGHIELANLHSGMRVADHPSIGHWFGLILADAGEKPPLADAYVRGRDLVARYEPLPSWPIGLELYWRVVESTESRFTLDLQISVNTGLLDGDPQLATRTELRAVVPRHETADNPLPSGMAVCKTSDDGLYAEMIHPTDFCGQRIERSGGDTIIEHSVFRERLEKGVIRRARLRAALLSAPASQQEALALYEQFAAEDPDLST